MRLALISLLLSSPIWAAFTSVYSITVDPTKVGGTNIGNYVLWVCANGSTAPCDAGTHTELSIPALKTTGNGGDVTSSSGYDVRFASDSACTAMLNYELEAGSYVPTTGFGSWFVQIGTASASVDTVIYMCIGDASITTDGTSTTAWTTDANFNRVWHMPVVTGSTTAGRIESTGQGATPVFGGVSTVRGDLLNGANAGLNASGQLFTQATETGLPVGASNPWSISMWFKTSIATDKFLFSYCQFSNNANCNAININHTAGKITLYASTLPNPASIKAVGATTVNDGNWHYVVVASNANNENKIYIDGALDGTNATQAASSTADSMCLNHVCNDGGTLICSACQDDELRVRTDYTAAGRILADYNNQSSPWTFYAFAEAAPASTVPHRVISQ
jgi:hypothetical protein